MNNRIEMFEMFNRANLKIIFCFLLPGTIKNIQAVDEITFLPRGRKIIS